jgi:hypothetical protein
VQKKESKKKCFIEAITTHPKGRFIFKKDKKAELGKDVFLALIFLCVEKSLWDLEFAMRPKRKGNHIITKH